MKILVANRGEIACRILRSLDELGVASVAVRTDVDDGAPHTWLATEVVSLGSPDGYLDGKRILAAGPPVSYEGGSAMGMKALTRVIRTTPWSSSPSTQTPTARQMLS